MSESFQPNYDLFGDEYVEVVAGKGRPEHVPTSENRNKIILLLADGWANKRIAEVIGVSLPTLRKHYFSELKMKRVALDRKRAALKLMIWDKAKGGSVPAMKMVDKQIEKYELDFGGAKFGKAKTAKKLGKKEQKIVDAKTTPGDSTWGFLHQGNDTAQ